MKRILWIGSMLVWCMDVYAQPQVPATTAFTRGFLRTTNQASAQAYIGSGGGGGGSVTSDNISIITNGNSLLSAQGLTNSGQSIFLTNNNGYTTLVVPLTPAASSNQEFNNQIQLFSGISSYGSTAGLLFPRVGTNFVAGQLWSTNIDPVTGLAVSNYIQNAGNMYQIGTVPNQSGTNKTTTAGGNIGQGMDSIWVASDPWMFGAFTGSGQQTGLIIYSNSVFHFLTQQATNYDGRGDNFSNSYLVLDANHSTIAMTNASALYLPTNVVIDFGSSLTSGQLGNAMLTNVGGLHYLNPAFLSPVGATQLTNLLLLSTASTALGFFNQGGNTPRYSIGMSGGNNDFSIYNVTDGEMIRFGSIASGDSQFTLWENLQFGWHNDGGGNIGAANGAGGNGTGRPANVYIVNTNNAGVLVIGNITNTASFTLKQTNLIDGSLNTNLTGRPIYLVVPCKLAIAAVSGNASYGIQVPGQATNYFAISSTALSIAMGYTNTVSVFVPSGSTYTVTNLSTGAGNSGAILNGSQYITF